MGRQYIEGIAVMNLVERIEAAGAKADIPRMSPGDTVRVHVKVKETTIKDDKAVGMKGKGIKEVERERVQVFEGIVIGLKGSGARATITVRKISFGEGVERIFPVNATTIEKIEIVKSARVRRAKLYYLRDRKGKAGRLHETKRTS
jgi:large subunit ribosomal protein L19